MNKGQKFGNNVNVLQLWTSGQTKECDWNFYDLFNEMDSIKN